ncbi:MAG: hypothetical protein IJF17_09815, partial [Thermoguttaceae bacterium]|nr:hypothetical protein [Thermoguttaceae bacterium]
MKAMQIFDSSEFGKLQAMEGQDGGIWFIGKEVAEKLGYKDSDQALRTHVDQEDKLTRQFNGSGQRRNMTIINESGLYSLILSSKLPNAKRFKRWVTSEVLPAIRKTGAYQPTGLPVFRTAPLPTQRRFSDVSYTSALAESFLDSHVAQFISAECALRSDEIYDAYIQWAVEMSAEVMERRQFFKATSKNLQFLQNYYSESRVPRNFCFLNRFVRDFPRFFSCLDLLYGEW